MARILYLSAAFFSLLVYASSSHHFEFDKVEGPKSSHTVQEEMLRMQIEVNQSLDQIQPVSLAVQIKKCLDIMLVFFVTSLRTKDIEDEERARIAYDFMAEHLSPKLASHSFNLISFFWNLHRMFECYELFTRNDKPLDRSSISGYSFFMSFFQDLLKKNQNCFTEEVISFLNDRSAAFWFECFQYATIHHLRTLKKDQVFKIVFRDDIPVSFTGEPLNVAIGNDQFLPFLEAVSKKPLRRMNLLVSNLGEGDSDYMLSENERVKLLSGALEELVRLAIPKIKARKWISIEYIDEDPKDNSENTNKNNTTNNSNNNGPTDTGLMGGKGKIFAICAVVVLIALLCGGFAFWHLRLRNKNSFAPSA
jgi:hypothetical protein